MLQHRYILVYGFAIFAMFFGSGNLVFPLQIGQVVGHNWLFGFLGLLLTGILLPFLGLFVIKLHKGDYLSFFGEAGSLAKSVLPFFTLSLLGSFGVVPRCITVAHGGIGYIFSSVPLWTFSLIFSAITFILCLKDKMMIKVLGKWLSPVLLIALLSLVVVAIAQLPNIEYNPQGTEGALQAFKYGFLTGYQTMDLLAAFFFSALIFNQIQQNIAQNTSITPTDREVIIFATKPSVVGALLLTIVYLGFVFLGAHYGHLTYNTEPEFILPTIAKHVMGDSAVLLISIVIILSCLTTAVALNNIYASYLCNKFKLSEAQSTPILFGTTSIAFTVSLLDFKGIAGFLAPVLEITYPGLIALTIMSIFLKGYKRVKKYSFAAITLCMAYYMLLA